ncbi:MAG TPA: chemotaxis protein CheW [Burkholderiales bacterium]|nr:chemotaxis protein CheW [Burkholderiales bacterium]
MTAMGAQHPLVVFTLGEQRYGLPLSSVERAVRIVEITPLPNGPDIVLGVINVQGRLIPVVNLRRRFSLPEHEVVLTDQIVVAHTQRRPVALVVDAIVGVLAYSQQQFVGAGEILPTAEYLDGVVKLDDGLILIHDLEKFLSLDEALALDAAMTGGE